MNRKFWEAAAKRALRTVCQAAIATIGSAYAISDVNWRMVLSVSALAGVLSVLNSIMTGLPEVEYAEHIHMSAPEPEDSYVDEIGIPESEDTNGEE